MILFEVHWVTIKTKWELDNSLNNIFRVTVYWGQFAGIGTEHLIRKKSMRNYFHFPVTAFSLS